MGSRPLTALLLVLTFLSPCGAFVATSNHMSLSRVGSGAHAFCSRARTVSGESSVPLRMKLDLVTYLRTEWISAALCSNQTPRSANVCLQLGTEDGRAVTFIPKTIRELITSSVEPDGKLSVTAKRQLIQQQDRRNAARVRIVDQPADNLKEVEDESVDVVISLQAAQRMIDNGLDWKKSVKEAARVLKPGGRLLFVEQTQLAGESYVEYVSALRDPAVGRKEPKEGEELALVFEEGNYDDVDLVLTPHVAGIAIKSEDAGLTEAERNKKASQLEKERVADLSLVAYERGIKKRKKKKKKKKAKDAEASEASS